MDTAVLREARVKDDRKPSRRLWMEVYLQVGHLSALLVRATISLAMQAVW
jgi:hypothetical protein